jgi:hypothetical protein
MQDLVAILAPMAAAEREMQRVGKFLADTGTSSSVVPG